MRPVRRSVLITIRHLELRRYPSVSSHSICIAPPPHPPFYTPPPDVDPVVVHTFDTAALILIKRVDGGASARPAIN